MSTEEQMPNPIFQVLYKQLEQYPPEEHQILSKFLTILNFSYQETSTSAGRTEIIRMIEDFISEYFRDKMGRPQKEYLEYPFLWFAIWFLQNLKLFLHPDVVDFHATEFQHYLRKHLRGNALNKNTGVFKLIKNGVSLKNHTEWGKMEEFTLLAMPKLTEKDIQIMKAAFSSLNLLGIGNFSSQRVHDFLARNQKVDKKAISRLFHLLDQNWMFSLPASALGIIRGIFHFSLKNAQSIQEIIDFQNPQNYILQNSRVYQVNGSSTEYTGFLVVAKEDWPKLESHMRDLDIQQKIQLHTLAEISAFRTFISLYSYQPSLGWEYLNTTDLNKLKSKLKTSQPRRRTTSPILQELDFITPLPRNLESTKIGDFVKLFLKFQGTYKWNNLPLDPTTEESRQASEEEIGLLKYLIQEQAIHFIADMERLRTEFSSYIYWTKIPMMPFFQIQRFLMHLPFGSIFVTDDHYYLWGNLPFGYVKWLNEHLKWRSTQVVQNHTPASYDPSWFDFTQTRWKTPIQLQEKKGKGNK
jgi:hypothetical protein